MAGSKTHEQQVRTYERKDDVPKRAQRKTHPERERGNVHHDPDARESEMPVSRHGMNQESRQHNQHDRKPAGAAKK